MVLMFWKCESDVLHGVSLQLSTLVGPCGSHHTLRCCSIQTSEGTDECLHLSLCLSAAQPGLSSSAQELLFFFLSGSFCLYTVSIFFSFLFFLSQIKKCIWFKEQVENRKIQSRLPVCLKRTFTFAQMGKNGKKCHDKQGWKCISCEY